MLTAMVKNGVTVALLVAIVVCLAFATIIEKSNGHEFVVEHIYGSVWFVGLWISLSVSGCVVIVANRLWKRKAVIGIHLSFLVILCGALLTHLTSSNGKIYLRSGETSNLVVYTDNVVKPLPFNVKLDSFMAKYYDGTDTPQDYVSKITVFDSYGKVVSRNTISMNKVVSYGNYRLLQASCSPDMQESVLSVCRDPYGMNVSYAGYGCLVLCMLFFFFDRNSMFRKSLHRIRNVLVFVLLLLPTVSFAEPTRCPSEEVANEFGKLLVLYQGRICPVNTLSIDFCRKMYHAKSHEGYSADQILCGWLFCPAEWHNRIDLNGSSAKDKQKRWLAESLYNGGLLKIYPVTTCTGSRMVWIGHLASLPDGVSVEDKSVVLKLQTHLQRIVMSGQDAEAINLIKELGKYQYKKLGGMQPSNLIQDAERLYNRMTHTKLVAMASIAIGLLGFVCTAVSMMRGRFRPLWYKWLEHGFIVLVLLYLISLFILRWIVMGTIPLSNGYEAMEFMALMVSLAAIVAARYLSLVLPAGLLVIGFCLLVALFGEDDPPITPLAPVLSSPLLSLHVVTVMLAYALMAIMFVVSLSVVIVAYCNRQKWGFVPGCKELEDSSTHAEMVGRLTAFNCLLLTPSVFLLAIGIFVGAVWANVSWGSYWHWDPKETWALITLLVYSVPLHKFTGFADRPVALNVYLAVSFLCVLTTYFGVNYFFGGMHSYA